MVLPNIVPMWINTCHSCDKSPCTAQFILVSNLYDTLFVVQESTYVNIGNVLNPLLFNIFINDLGDFILDTEAPVLYDSRISGLIYADD